MALRNGDAIEFDGVIFTKAGSTDAEAHEFADQAGFETCIDDETHGLTDWDAAANGDVVITAAENGAELNDEEVTLRVRSFTTISADFLALLSVGDKVVFDSETFTRESATSVSNKEFVDADGLADCIDALGDWEAEESTGSVVVTAEEPGDDFDDEDVVVYHVGITHTKKNSLVTYSQPKVKGSANTDHENADTGDAPTNHQAVSAESAVATTWTKGAITQPDIARNIGIVITNSTSGSLELYKGVMTFTVTGKFRGSPQVEEITFTSNTENATITNGGTTSHRVKYGVKPFDIVEDITLDNLPDDALEISACPGSKVGLPVALLTPHVDDVLKVNKNGVDADPDGKINTANQTINLDTLSDDDTFSILYNGIETVSLPGMEDSEKKFSVVNSEETVTITNADATVSISNASAGAISASTASEVGAGTEVTASPRLIAIGT